MSVIAKKFEPDVNLLEGQLHHWFGIDQLRPVQGIALLIGLIPDDKTVAAISDWGNNKVRDDEILDFNIELLNGDEINSWPKSEHPYDDHIEATIRFSNLVEQHRQIKQYWLTGKHPAHPPLSYFVEWARSKGINPDWKPIAVKLGLIPGGASATEEKPITTIERNTLLTIIAALCDYSAIKYQERGAAGQIAKITEEIGAPVTDDTIRTVLAKIPDALETRMK